MVSLGMYIKECIEKRLVYIMFGLSKVSFRKHAQVVKIEAFQQNFFYIFLIFAQNIDCGYTLEPPCKAVLKCTHNLCFEQK